MRPDRNNGANTGQARTRRGRFAPGNPGRPKGARNRVSLAVEALLDGEAEALTRKAIDLAKAGDMAALRLCLERIAPPRKERATPFDLPPITGAADHPQAIAALIGAVAQGDLSPGEAEALVKMFAEHRRSIEVAELDARIKALEERA